MSKNRSAAGITNIIRQDSSGNIVFTSGSTTLATISTAGQLSGSTAVLSAQTASFANAFTVAGTLTAQTLVVQTITSSVDFVTGSTRFGSLLANTHVFSGSVTMNPGGLFVSSSGNVGIGTTPNTTAGITELAIGSSNTNPLISGIRDGVSAFALSSDSAGTLLNERRNLDLRFSTNNTEKMRISGSNVCIGSTSFTSPSGADTILGVYGGQDCSLILQDAVQLWELYVNDDFYINRGSTNVFTALRSNGNVGIGVTNPTGSLSIKAEQTNTPTIAFQNSLGGPNSAISNYTSAAQTFTVIGTNAYVNSAASLARFNTSFASSAISFDEGDIAFSTGTSGITPTQRMRILSGGDVNIAGGNVRSLGGGYVLRDSANTTTGGLFTPRRNWLGSGTDISPTIAAETGYGIYTYTNGSVSPSGPYVAPGGTTWTNGSSDVRKKKNFETTQGLAEILQVEPIKYHFNEDDDDSKKRLGFKAQNILPLIPEMVSETGEMAEDGSPYLTVTPDYILPVLVKAIQELKAQNDDLQSQINELKAQ
jgi:hypothetical protein